MLFALLFSCQEVSQTSETVARVGEEQITFDDFIYNFTLFPQYQPNSTLRDARLQHLDHMADRIILYLAAEKENLDQSEEIQQRIEYIRHKEVLKYLYQQEVLSKIPVSDENAWEEYERSNLQVKLHHLFAGTLEEAQEYSRRLQNGESFEKIARETFLDSTLANNGGDLGFVSINDLDAFLADSVYNLSIGQNSRPLKSSFGYHIMRVENVKQSIFLSKEYFAEHKEDYVNSLRKRRARVKSAEYLATVLAGKSVTIKSAVMKELLNINKSQIKIRRQETPMPLPSVTDRELQNVSRQVENENLQNRILVEFNGESWAVGEFLIKLKQMPPLHRQTINSRESLFRHIIDMVRDELLLQEAYRQGIHKNKAVTAIVEKWRKELLADEFRKRILWVDYQKENPEKWQTRKTLYQALKTEIPVVVDSTILFHDVNENQLQQRVPALPTVIRDYYMW
jgi:hypothetical protein